LILKKSGVEYDRIYINNLEQGWQKESLAVMLAHLEIPQGKLLVVNGDCVIQASTLIVPSVPFTPYNQGPLPAWLKKDLQAVFLGKAQVSTHEKIYISRNRARSRRIRNEEELITQLRLRGFAIMHLEEISPYVQAEIFNRARLIVGPHGSAFANLVFTKPGFQLVEIDHGSEPPRSYYRAFTQLMGGVYTPFYVDQVSEERMEEDMKIDIPALLHVIDKSDTLANMYWRPK
jgi:capsular polysaccharide biosynthesis protein